MTARLALPLLAAFTAAFLVTRPSFRSWFRGLVGSLYRGRRVEGVRTGWREPYDPEYEVTGV